MCHNSNKLDYSYHYINWTVGKLTHFRVAHLRHFVLLRCSAEVVFAPLYTEDAVGGAICTAAVNQTLADI